MSCRIHLFIGDRHCLAAKWKRGMLASQQVFPNSEEGVRQYGHYLEGVRSPSAGILADLVEEDYRPESVPHLNWRDRKPYQAKKLEQFYRHTPLRNALFQGREGKNDRVLFSALTSPNLVLPWVELMAGRRITLSGICSVALLSSRLVESILSSHVLLLSFQNRAGLRQSFFLNGRLNFSRLTPGEDPVAIVEAESGRIYKYLHTLNLLPEREALIVCILCGREDRKRLEKILPDTASVHHVFFDVRSAAERIGFRGELSGSDALPLFLHLLGEESNQYGTPEHTHVHDLAQWQRASNALSAALILAGSVLSGIDASRAVSLRIQAGILAAKTDSVMFRYRELVPLADSPQRTKEAVSLYERVASARPGPGMLLSEVSRALEPFPGIRINRLSWQTESPDGVDFLGHLHDQAISVEGEIFPFDGNYRIANDTVDRFCAELKKNGISVTKVILPLDLSPDVILVGKSGKAEGKAEFSLKAVRKGMS